MDRMSTRFGGATATRAEPVPRLTEEQLADATRLSQEMQRLRDKVKLYEKRDDESRELVEELHDTVDSIATHVRHYPHELEQRVKKYLSVSIPKEADRK